MKYEGLNFSLEKCVSTNNLERGKKKEREDTGADIPILQRDTVCWYNEKLR